MKYLNRSIRVGGDTGTGAVVFVDSGGDAGGGKGVRVLLFHDFDLAGEGVDLLEQLLIAVVFCAHMCGSCGHNGRGGGGSCCGRGIRGRYFDEC